jgi:hypothetical protein
MNDIPKMTNNQFNAIMLSLIAIIWLLGMIWLRIIIALA